MSKTKCLLVPAEGIQKFDRLRNQVVVKLTDAHTVDLDFTKLPDSINPLKEEDILKGMKN